MAETVDDDHGERRSLCDRLQYRVDLPIRDVGNCHQVGGGLVPQLGGVCDHVDGLRDLVRIEGDPDHVEGAFRCRDEVRLPVALARVRHGCQFEPGGLRVVAPHDAAEILIVAMPPGSEVVGRKNSLRILVADLHVVDAGINACLVNGAYLLVTEAVGVHEAAIADRAV